MEPSVLCSASQGALPLLEHFRKTIAAIRLRLSTTLAHHVDDLECAAKAIIGAISKIC